jgi:hypothetical protein
VPNAGDEPAGDEPSGHRAKARPAARQVLGKAIRRGARGLDAAQARLLQDGPAQPGGRLAGRAAGASGAGGGPAARGGRRRGGNRWALGGRPGARARRPEGGAASIRAARETLFRALEGSGDLGLAATAAVRAHLAVGAAGRARTFAQVLQHQDGTTRELGDVCMAMTAGPAGLSRTAWELFTGVEQRVALRLAPAEYLRTAFA